MSTGFFPGKRMRCKIFKKGDAIFKKTIGNHTHFRSFLFFLNKEINWPRVGGVGSTKFKTSGTS